MTIRHIKIFLTICDNENNITKAAEKLFIAQPAVSFALNELENYYGVKFFDRISRKLYITEAGKQFRDYATHIVSLFDEMEKRMRDGNAGEILRIGASFTIGSQFMPCYVKTFCELYPEADVRVKIEPSKKLEEMLLRNELDFALIESGAHEANIIEEEYMQDSLAVVCPAIEPFHQGDTLTLEEFKKQRFLLREYGSGTREVFDNVMESKGINIIPAWEGMSTTALVNAAIQGLGITVLPYRLIHGPLERGMIVTVNVEGLEFNRKFKIIYHKNKFLTNTAKAFMELCRNYELDYPLPKYNGIY